MTRSVEIPPEVVEKAAHAMYADNEAGEWENDHLDTLLQYRRAARIAIAAALPYLAPAEVVIDHRPGETCSVAAEVDPETGFARAPAGDGGLREALKELAQQRDTVGGSVRGDYVIAPYEVFDLLKDHPAAPAVPQPVDREALERIRAYLAVAPRWDELAYAWDQDAGVPRKILASDLRTLLALLAGEQEQVEK